MTTQAGRRSAEPLLYFNRMSCIFYPLPLILVKMPSQQKQAAPFPLALVICWDQSAMTGNDVSNQSLHLAQADELLLGMTGTAAFQQPLIDISSRG